MKRSFSTVPLAPGFVLVAPGGWSLPLTDARAEVTYRGTALSEFQLICSISPHQWAEIDRRALFHLTPEARGENFGDGFDPDEPFELEIKLDERHLAQLATKTANAQQAATLVRNAAVPHDPLTHTESWFCMFVKQQDGPLKIGFATRYSGLLPQETPKGF